MLHVNRVLLVSSLLGCAAAVHAGGNHDFKLRVGRYANVSERFIVGSLPETRTAHSPFSFWRIRGQDPKSINISYEIVDGDPSLWQIELPVGRTLGSAPTLAPADVNKDGAVDLIDFAQFQLCFSGDGGLYTPGSTCVGFDADNDLDVDTQDLAVFNDTFTGPRELPWRHDLELSVTAPAETSEGAMVRIRLTAEHAASGETHHAYVYVTKKSYGLSLDVANRSDFTQHRTAKLVFARGTWFGLNLILQGADPVTAEVLADPVLDPLGFEFETVNVLLEPQTEFTLAPTGHEPDGDPPTGRLLRINVTTPEGWERLSEETITFRAASLSGQASSSVDARVIKAAGLWTPSDLFGPDGRRHLVRAGAPTTYILWITNIVGTQQTFSLFATQGHPTPGWQVSLSAGSVTLAPGEQTEVIATIRPPVDAAAGATADFEVSLSNLSGFFNAVRLGAEVTGTHKVIYIAPDGLQPEYMYLNAAGTGPGSDGDWLMPRVHELMTHSTNYTNSKASLPAVTDTNHVNALCGTRAGRSGVPTVYYYYHGADEDGAAVLQKGDSDLLRYGPNGDPVLSAFDVAKQVHPRAYTAYATGKNWLAEYFVKETGGVDVVVNGRTLPFYVNTPEPYVLGDPPSDADAAQDPRLHADFPDWGFAAGLFPDDRWVLENALRVIANEDPDVFYILLAGPDDAQHQMGCSWDPAEWDDQGTATLWDDINRINPLATREEVIDVIRELDVLVGELIDFLQARGTFNDTYLALLSDHGMMTQTPPTVDVRTILEPAGYGYKDDFDAYAGAGFGLIYGVAAEDEADIEFLLEHADSIAPGESENPWVVMNRQEMRTGVDVHTGIALSRFDELYSEFYVEHELPNTERQKWPSFYVFLLGHYQHDFTFIQAGEDAEWGRLFVGGHAGPNTQHIPTILHGPGVPAGQVIDSEVSIADITPTLYHLLGWPTPPSVEGTVLPGLGEE